MVHWTIRAPNTPSLVYSNHSLPGYWLAVCICFAGVGKSERLVDFTDTSEWHNPGQKLANDIDVPYLTLSISEVISTNEGMPFIQDGFGGFLPIKQKSVSRYRSRSIASDVALQL